MCSLSLNCRVANRTLNGASQTKPNRITAVGYIIISSLSNFLFLNLFMRRTIEIIVSSFKMALQELWKNKLRTFLSLFGVTIGIFCIIGVLATVNSLELNIQSDIKSCGRA